MRVIVIGGSAGSIEALHQVLMGIPRDIDAAVAVVVHLPPKSPSLLASVLGGYTPMPVREAFDKMPLVRGEILVGPPDYHLLVERNLTVSLSRDPEVHFSRPAIDPLFESAADAAGAAVIGVLLTGSNEDGAVGLATIQRLRGQIAVQDPATAIAPEMPMAALRRSTPDLTASPAAIGQWLATLVAVSRPR